MTDHNPELDPRATKRALRRLHGEPTRGDSQGGAASAEARFEHDGRAERVERLWRALEPPPASDPPPDFAARTARELRTRLREGQSGRAATGGVPIAWARGTAAAALAAGLLLGLGVGRWAPDPVQPAPGGPAAEVGSGVDSEPWNEGAWSEDAWSEDAWSEAWDQAYAETFVSVKSTGGDS